MKILIALLAFTAVAFAAPPEGADPALKGWYDSLVNQAGAHCCGIADCRHPDAVRWTGTGRQVRFGNDWFDVPNDAIIPRENPTGAVVACMVGGVDVCFIGIVET